MSHKLILIGGVAGAGKTTIGKEIANRIGFLVDKDSVVNRFTEKMLERLVSNVDEHEYETYLNQISDIECQIVRNVAMDNIKLGRTVVCAAPFIKELSDIEWVECLRREVESHYADLVTVYLDVDFETSYKRIVERNADRDKWKIKNKMAYKSSFPSYKPRADFYIDNDGRESKNTERKVDHLIAKLSGYI